MCSFGDSEKSTMSEEEFSEFWGYVLDEGNVAKIDKPEIADKSESKDQRVKTSQSVNEPKPTLNPDVIIRSKPSFVVTSLSNNKKRHSLVVSDKSRAFIVWLGDGDQPMLNNLSLKEREMYTFVIEVRPDWAGAAIVQPGVTSPPGFLKRITLDEKIVWEDETFRENKGSP